MKSRSHACVASATVSARVLAGTGVSDGTNASGGSSQN